jgi:hypothetical protein
MLGPAIDVYYMPGSVRPVFMINAVVSGGDRGAGDDEDFS